MHGKAEDWKEGVSSKQDKQKAERLINANCYSASGVKCTLSAVAAELITVRLAILKILLAGFFPSEATHGRDSGVGAILRETAAARECIDYAHVQVSCCGFVLAQLHTHTVEGKAYRSLEKYLQRLKNC